MLAAVVALVAAVAPGPAAVRAQAPTKRAIRLFHEARIHYNMGQYGLAADKLNAGIRADPSLPGLYRNLGLTYRAMGRCELALPHFRRYLKLAPGGRHVERVRQEIAYCTEKLGAGSGRPAPVGRAHILVRVNVEGAQITVDGVERGSSGTGALPVEPGRHVVTVFKSGHLPWTRAVRVDEGQVLELEVALRRDPAARAAVRVPTTRPASRPGKLRLEGLPAGASVTVDGALVRPDASGEIGLPAGAHTLRVTRRGLEPWGREVTIEPDGITAVVPHLPPTPGTRSLRTWGWIATASGAALAVAGAVVGLVQNQVHQDAQGYDRSTGSREELNRLLDRRDRLGLAANLLYGCAAAAVGAGVVLFTVTPEVERRGALVSAGGRF